MHFALHKSYPLTIGLQDSNFGNRFGGRPPKNFASKSAIYLFTFEYNTDEEVSVGLLYEPGDFEKIWSGKDRLLNPKDGFVEIAMHKRSPRVEDVSLSSCFPSCSLLLGSEQDDSAGDQVYPHHKLGGLPFFQRNTKLAEESDRLIKLGYRHAIQLMFPDHLDAPINVSWPFGEYGFHIFIKVVDDSPEFLCCWG